jgi:hypothetical protein
LVPGVDIDSRGGLAQERFTRLRHMISPVASEPCSQ